MLVIAALLRQRQKDHKFKASLVSTVGSSLKMLEGKKGWGEAKKGKRKTEKQKRKQTKDKS